VDLANTARYGGLAALHQGFVGLAHDYPRGPPGGPVTQCQ
jgi:hypothetical protein